MNRAPVKNRRFLRALCRLVIGWALLSASAAHGQGAPDLQAVESRGTLAAAIGVGRLVTLPLDIERVALADEGLARLQVVSARELLLTGLRTGASTLFVWLSDGQRLRYGVEIVRDLSFVRKVLADLDPRIALAAGGDGSTVVLSGEAPDRETAAQAEAIVAGMLKAQGGAAVQVVNLLRAPTSTTAPDLWLTEALGAIDARIRLRRIQVGAEPNPERDSYILEGRVKNVQALARAVILAERQLGNAGVRVESPARGLSFGRNRVFPGTTGATGAAGNASLAASDRPLGGLPGQIARGLAITSESGRVLSMLEVDELPQIMVSIRVLEIDRARAKKAGFNFRFDAEHLSLGSFPGPQGRPPRQLGGLADVSAVAGNLVGSFVDRTLSIVSAIDFLEDQNLARSVSEPNILTLSGEEASVLVGGEVPIPITTLSQANSVQGFAFQDFGVRLDIRPTVDETGVIALEVAPSIIRPSPTLSVGGVPGFQVQSVQTTARVSAGQSLVLGGLLSFQEGFEESRLPVLGKSPLFRWRRKSRQQQELLFVITPRLVASGPTPAPPVEPALGAEVGLPAFRWLGEEGAPLCAEPEPALDATGLPPGFRRDPFAPH